MNHLLAMIKLDNERRADAEYFHTVLWSIAKMLGGDNYTLPSYDEYKHPAKPDNRSADDIMSKIKNKLAEGGAD